MLSHLRVWGSSAYVKHLKTDKLGSRSDKYLFIGYPKKSRGYYFYLTEEQKMFVSSRAVFLKKKFLKEGIDATNIELDEVWQIKELTQSSGHTKLDLIRESNLESVVEIPLSRSDRIPHQSNKYYSFLFRNGDPVELDENDKDSITYMDGM